jgi:hypothetical protein
LKLLGFEIADDNKMAKHAGGLEVSIARPADVTQAEFLISITLDNGTKLTGFTRRRALLDAKPGVANEEE